MSDSGVTIERVLFTSNQLAALESMAYSELVLLREIERRGIPTVRQQSIVAEIRAIVADEQERLKKVEAAISRKE